jgi:hypothetical protein
MPEEEKEYPGSSARKDTVANRVGSMNNNSGFHGLRTGKKGLTLVCRPASEMSLRLWFPSPEPAGPPRFSRAASADPTTDGDFGPGLSFGQLFSHDPRGSREEYHDKDRESCCVPITRPFGKESHDHDLG